MKVSVMILIGCMASIQHVFADDIKLRVVTMNKSPTPKEVSIENENTTNKIALDQATGNIFTTSISRPPIKEELKPSPYRLVSMWDNDENEQLYLAFSSRTPRTVEIQVQHLIESPDLPTLENIDALNSDFSSMLKKYFRARALYKKWRLIGGQSTHKIAIRSAKIWFDASVNLAKLTNSYFRIDEEIKAIMADYEKKAKNDSWFREQYRNYASSGYISATLEQVLAAQYQFVGEIPTLVANQRLDEAQDLNEKAVAALERESLHTRRIVSKRQGIDLDLLKANTAYISTLQGNGQ